MSDDTRLYRRQLWNFGVRPTHATQVCHLTSHKYHKTKHFQYCPTITLPAQGVLSLASDQVITLTSELIFRPLCTHHVHSVPVDDNNTTLDRFNFEEPFYSSVIPQVYVIAAATVLAWVLVVMLVISPRTFYASINLGASPAGRLFGTASTRPAPLIGVGSRPWLQKAAALTVAISLTIATADTFKSAKYHYLFGHLDGNLLRQMVENSLEIRVTRAISNIFVWLAQVQTLIRLFPRHREKILIKWIAFVLVIADTIFSCLNSFYVENHDRPRHFDDAISALNYLFQLAVGLLYAAWVLYYSFTKRRYAFWHANMKNISLIAFLALVSILTPVVFFVTDITIPDIAGWGDYFRWVGAAAASVVVWEWVERIEALERDEKKDGILGREVFDGDDMLGPSTAADMVYVRRKNDKYVTRGSAGSGGSSDVASSTTPTTGVQATIRKVAHFRRRRHEATKTSSAPLPAVQTISEVSTTNPTPTQVHFNTDAIHPRTAVSPINRADTTSAASTVYVVRHDGIDNAPQPVRRRMGATPEPAVISEEPEHHSALADADATPDLNISDHEHHPPWYGVSHRFKRKRTSPPSEVRAVMSSETGESSSIAAKTHEKQSMHQRLGVFAARNAPQARRRHVSVDEVELPWIVIPVQPRGAAAWSPDQVAPPVDHQSADPIGQSRVDAQQGSDDDKAP